jgi:hypothetical protein
LSELNRALAQAPDDAARGALIDRLRSTLAGAV